MPASPLMAAMLAGSGNTEGGYNPAMATALPDIQLGQQMVQQGMSTEPASPWQALARVAQAGAGTYLQRSAISDLAKLYAGTAKNMASILPAQDPYRAGLLSDDPTVYGPLVQGFQKHLMTIEPEKLRPGEDIQYPGASGPSGGSSRPVSQFGQEQYDINNPQGYAPRGVPQGPPRITATPPTPTAAVPPPVPQKYQGGMLPGQGRPTINGVVSVEDTTPKPPSAAPPATFSQRFGGSNDMNPLAGAVNLQAQAAGAKAGAEETAKNQANLGQLLKPQGPLNPNAPGQTKPVTTDSGTTIPALSDQAPIPQSPDQLKAAIPKWQETTDNWTKSIGPAQQAEQRLNTIANAFKQIQTGSFQTHKADFAAGLLALGVPQSAIDLLGTDPAQVQLALHENYSETMQQLKAATSRFTQQEFKITSENKEHPNLQPSANLQMLAEDIGTLRQAQNLPADWAAAQRNGWQNPQSFEQAWLKKNPISGYVNKVKTEIGPLKGMPEASPAAPTTWTDPQTKKTYKIINGVPHE